MDLFDRQWNSYRAIVEHNLMEHRQVAEATAVAIEGWLAARPQTAPAPRMVDLGCGDLALLAPLLRRLPLGSYTGLDLAAVVLPLAAAALGPVPYPTEWQEGDLLAWALAPGGATGAGPVDILHSAYAIHHLGDDQKRDFLISARQRLKPSGIFVWVDVFRGPRETREQYVQRYSQRIERLWGVLTAEQQQQVIDHLSSCDFPADREAIRAVAEASGWHWHWAWQGTHQAEALAVLTPA